MVIMFPSVVNADGWDGQYQQVEAGIRQFKADTIHQFVITLTRKPSTKPLASAPVEVAVRWSCLKVHGTLAV